MKKEKEEIGPNDEVRFNMVAPKWWLDMVENDSKKKGINKSAYLRQLGIEANERSKSPS